MRVRTLILAASVLALAGCGTLRGLFTSDVEKTRGPAELPELQESLAIQRVWSLKLGDEQQRQGLRRQAAIEGERLYVSNDEGRVLAVDLNSGDVLWDSEVVKTYVRLGMGVGVISEQSMEPTTDAGLAYIDARHLFPLNTTWVGFARGSLIRGFVYDFLALLAPHLSRSLIERAAACTTQSEVDALFETPTPANGSQPPVVSDRN